MVPMTQSEARVGNIFGAPTEGDLRFLQSHTQTYLGNVSVQHRQAAMDSVLQAQEQARAWQVAHRVNAVSARQADVFTVDGIHGFERREQFQNAKSVMQHYIASMPVAVEAYRRGEISLYEEASHKRTTERPVDNFYYREMRHGIAQENASGEFTATLYAHHVPDSFVRADRTERAMLHDVERSLTDILENDLFDPTSVWNELKD